MYVNRLLGLMREHGHTQNFIAEKLGISPYGLRLKLKGSSQFKANEIKILADLYNISVDYFFSDEVAKIAINNWFKYTTSKTQKTVTKTT